MDFRLEQLAVDEIEQVRGLWMSLHEYHARVGSSRLEIAPMRSAEAAWEVRGRALGGWLREPGAFALVARDEDGEQLGLAVVRLKDSPGTWEVGERVGELTALVVSESARGRGVGEALTRECMRRLREDGIRLMSVEVLSDNEGAIAFYERAGAVETSRVYWLPLDGAGEETS